jgi:hypothetical protein
MSRWLSRMAKDEDTEEMDWARNKTFVSAECGIALA